MWYVIRTEPGQEESVRRQVRGRLTGRYSDDCKVLYRACKKRYLGAWHQETEMFLPGYVFLVAEDEDSGSGWMSSDEKSDERSENEGAFGNDRGLKGREMRPVEKTESEFLKRITGGKDEIGMSYGVIRDGVLKISQGAMTGMEERVTKIDRHKRKGYIRVRLGDEVRMAEIGLEITEKTDSTGDLPGSEPEKSWVKDDLPRESL